MATSLSKLGDFYLSYGETKGFDLILESHQLIEHILDLDPNNVDFLFDYAISFMRIGRLFIQVDQDKAKLFLINAKEI